MKYLILFLFLLPLLPQDVLAQDKRDSLLNIWEDTSKPDSLRIKVYSKVIWNHYIFSKPDSARILANNLLQFSRTNENAVGIANAYGNLGTINYVEGKYLDAIKFYEKALELYKKTKQPKSLASTLGNLAAIHILLGNYSSAIKYNQESLDMGIKNNDTGRLSAAYTNMGNIYYYQEEFEPALEYYRKSLEYQNKKNQDANTLNNIGAIQIQFKKYKEARKNIQKGIDINIKQDNKLALSEAMGTMARVYAAENNYDEAIVFYQKSLAIKDQIGDGATGEALSAIGNIYIKQGSYQKAIKFCSQGMRVSAKNKALNEEYICVECLYQANKAIGNNSQALVYHEKLSDIKTELRKEETSKELQQLEYTKKIIADSIQSAQEKEKIELAHKIEVQEKDFNRNLLMGAGLISLLLAGGFYSRWKFVNRSKKVLEEEKGKSDKLLLNILPADIAHELKNTGQAAARNYENATILFSDFKEFTQISEQMNAAELVENINFFFGKFDDIMKKHNIEKIKTIGDAYMAVGGLQYDKTSTKNTILAALDMQDLIKEIAEFKTKEGGRAFQMRVGIHSGSLVAGIVGAIKFQYDVWGDSVNTASRMESNGAVGEVNISAATYELLKYEEDLQFESRGNITVKGKGEMKMYFVRRK